YKNAHFCPIALYVFDEYVSNLGRLFGDRLNFLYFICLWRFGPVIHVKENRFVNNVRHIYITDMNIFYDPATSSRSFKSNPLICTHKCTIFYKNLRAPSYISLPTTKPPCPNYTLFRRIITFSVGIPLFRPSSSFPDLIQIASSPTSKIQSSMSTLEQDSISIPSPFCA